MDDLPNVKKCLEILSSEAFFLLLSQLTGLELHPLYKEYEASTCGMENSSKLILDIYASILTIWMMTNFISFKGLVFVPTTRFLITSVVSSISFANFYSYSSSV